jgi:hypothetical protein
LSKARQHHSSSTSLVHQLHPIGRLGFTSVTRQYELCGHFMAARAPCFSMFEPQSATAQSRRQHVTAGHASAAQRLQVCQCSCPPLHPHLHTKASSGSDAAIIIALQCSCTAAAVAMPAIFVRCQVHTLCRTQKRLLELFGLCLSLRLLAVCERQVKMRTHHN